jgi:hypothetical protein
MSMLYGWWFKVVFALKIACELYIYIYIYSIFVANSAIRQVIYMFLAKTSRL